jgi:hypothetical protein
MGHPVKIDETAFNRGVDDVITLKPVRRALGMAVDIVSGRRNKGSHEATKGGKTAVARHSKFTDKKK